MRRYGRTIDIDRERDEALLQELSQPSALDYGNLGLGIGGTLMGAYGTYQAAQQAERQNDQAMEAYRDDRDRERRLDNLAEEQRGFNNTMSLGNYARQLEDDVYGTYSPWARAQGY